ARRAVAAHDMGRFDHQRVAVPPATAIAVPRAYRSGPMPGAADRNHARAEGFELDHHMARRLEHAKAVVVRLRQHHGRKAARDAALERVEIADPARVLAGLPG